MTDISVRLKIVQIENPEALNLILGQSHFIKTVEDIHEAVVTGVPGVKFGLAFCESSGLALVRSTGTDDELKALAERNALALGAGHCFILFLRDAYPDQRPERHQDGARGGEHLLRHREPGAGGPGRSEQGRGILGVIDGIHTQGIEDADGVAWRKGFLRKIGYKIG